MRPYKKNHTEQKENVLFKQIRFLWYRVLNEKQTDDPTIHFFDVAHNYPLLHPSWMFR